MANNNIIQNSKQELINGLSKIITDEDIIKTLVNKINNLDVIILESDEFIETWHSLGGKGIFAPGGFTHNNTVYLKNDNLNIHTIIHEMLHGITEFKHENGYKSGLLVGNKQENYTYGRGFNESFTEYLTSLLLEDSFSEYSKDFYYIIQIFMQLTNLDITEMIKLYIGREELLNDKIIKSFNSDNNDLVGLVIEYDNKLDPSKSLNPNNVFQILFNSIKFKINNNEKLDVNKISDLLKNYYNYYYEVDLDLDNVIKTEFAEILDILGTYKNKISR